ncbi:MAG: BtpA/SgcQ family protein [Bacteroidota bacterium]
MSNRQVLFPHHKPIIGMIHVPALPGTPGHHLSMPRILDQVKREVETYQVGGVDAIMLENMHDLPYLKREVGPEIVASMTMCAQVLRSATDLPAGIQILAGANQAALSVALAADLQFIRAEGFVFGHLADEGLMDADAGPLLRFRKMIEATHVQIFADLKKKHSAHALTADVSLLETAHAAEFFGVDGVIITGVATGKAADLEDIRSVNQQLDLPVWVGSGITADNVADYLAVADGLIIGSWLKKDGNWREAPDPERIQTLMQAVRRWRESS